MAKTPKFQPKTSIELKSKPLEGGDLSKEIERRKQRDRDAGEAPETLAVIKNPPVPVKDSVLSVLPLIKKTFDDLAAKRRDFEHDIANDLGGIEPEECPVHAGEFRRPDLEETIKASWQPNKLVVRFGICPLCKSELLVNERHKRWITRGVPVKVAHATLNNYEADNDGKKRAVEAARHQSKKKRGFFLACGNPGNGKSHLAVGVLKEIGDGLFITHGELVDELRSTYEVGGKERMVAKYQTTPCLVLDEVIPDLKGSDVEPLQYRILAYRFDRDLITCLTTNEDVSSLLKILGPKLEDRMAQNYSIANFTWESYRKQHRER